jgi:hypothetical protein
MTKLRPGGVLLFNVSNKYIDVSSVLAGEGAALNLVSFLRTDVVVTPAEAAAGKFVSAWVVMAADGANLGDIPHRPGWGAMRADPHFPLWTDDFSDVLAVTRLG